MKHVKTVGTAFIKKYSIKHIFRLLNITFRSTLKKGGCFNLL